MNHKGHGVGQRTTPGRNGQHCFVRTARKFVHSEDVLLMMRNTCDGEVL